MIIPYVSYNYVNGINCISACRSCLTMKQTWLGSWKILTGQCGLTYFQCCASGAFLTPGSGMGFHHSRIPDLFCIFIVKAKFLIQPVVSFESRLNGGKKMWLITEKLGFKFIPDQDGQDPDPKWFIPDPDTDPAIVPDPTGSGSTILLASWEECTFCLCVDKLQPAWIVCLLRIVSQGGVEGMGESQHSDPGSAMNNPIIFFRA
jgi:hypothetical protein